MNFVYHLHAGVRKWSPTSSKIETSKAFVRDFLQEKTGIRIDFPNSQGGTSPLETWQGNEFPENAMKQIAFSDGL